MRYMIVLGLLGLGLLHEVMGSAASNPASPVRASRWPAPQAVVTSALPYLNTLPDHAAFLKLSRTYESGKLPSVPHLLFMIERAKKRPYFIDSKRFDFHYSFAKAISLTSDWTKIFFSLNYRTPDRPLILGTLSYLKTQDAYAFEFDSSDRLTNELIEETYTTLKSSIKGKLVFRPVSLAHDEIAATLKNIPLVPSDIVRRTLKVEVFRAGIAVGILKLGCCVDPDSELTPDHIPVFGLPPVHVPPVRAILTTEPSSPLSHAHMLARSWKVPDAMVTDAEKRFQAFDGQWVRIDVRSNGKIDLRLATAEERQAARKDNLQHQTIDPQADLAFRDLAPLGQQTKTDVIRFGAKSANLGEVMRIKGVAVPDGFSIPFVHYKDFFEQSGAAAQARDVIAGPDIGDPVQRKRLLTELRDRMQKAPMDPVLQEKILATYRSCCAGRGVFVRSSTNAEDLPGFNGAGLYTTVPNVKDEAALIEAVKTVWASVWNLEAFDARTQAGIDHFKVYGAVLIQLGVNADSAGVMITANPYRKGDGSFLINAKKGLGIRVVDGHKVPEQVLYNPKSASTLLLSRSGEDVFLSFDEKGGVRERTIQEQGARVLTEDLAQQLAKAGEAIQARFGGVPQDIEWVAENGHIMIVQSRPYLD